MLFLTQSREGFMSLAGIKSTTFTLAKQHVLTTTLLEASMWYKSYCHSNKTNRGITVLTSNLPRWLQVHQLCLLASKQKPAHYLTNTDYPSSAKMKKKVTMKENQLMCSKNRFFKQNSPRLSFSKSDKWMENMWVFTVTLLMSLVHIHCDHVQISRGLK